MQKTRTTCDRPTIMKRLLNIVLLLTFFSCDNGAEKSNAVWDKHNVDFKKVVELIKADKLNVVYGRTGYAIPDSIDLKATCGQLAFRMFEFEHDTSYTICFNLDTNKQKRTSPEIIYTENVQRIEDYESRMTRVIKLDKNWFYSPSGL